MLGGAVPGIGPVLVPALEALGNARRRTRETPHPPEERRELYRLAPYRVVAWLERRFGTPPVIYVAVERNGIYGIRAAPNSPGESWQQVRLWSEILLTPAPWWAPWRRKRELGAVIEQAIAFVDEQDSLETTAAATLEAFTEATRLT
jgi:hypothetical protein